MANRSIKLSPAQQKKVVAFIHDRLGTVNIQGKRQRYATIDKAMQLESDKRRAKMKGRDQRLDYMDDIEVALISPAIDTIQGFLVDLYLGTTPIFPVVSPNKEMAPGVSQFNTILEQEEKDFAWGRQMAIWFRSLAKYNLGGVECEWSDRVTSAVAGSQSGPAAAAKIAQVAVSGNKILSMDMYNLYYDETVAPAEVHSDGEFVAYAEHVTMIKMAQMFADLEYSQGITMNKDLAYKSHGQTSNSKYYECPEIIPEYAVSEGARGWQKEFDSVFESAKRNDAKPTSSKAVYERVTFYARIIPSMFGIKTPGQDDVQIFKFIMVGNQHIVYCEHQNNVHGYFPILLGQLREDGLKEQTKSSAELLAPLQNLSTKIYDARLASLARAVGDRLAYVAGVIDDKDVKSQNPISRIAMRPNALYKNIRDAIYQIPYRDDMGGTFLQEMNFNKQQSQDVARMNRPQLGQFQKGNKTLGEFNTVMKNSQQELRIMGILLENQCMMPLKSIIKSNVLQYQKAATLVQNSTGSAVQISPELIRKSYMDFKLADGLQNQEELMDIQLFREFLQYAIQDPEVRQTYAMTDILAYIFEMSGAKIAQFKRPEGQVPPPLNPPPPQKV